jgi:RNA polymerase sigma factor (TIGR02999 family)
MSETIETLLNELRSGKRSALNRLLPHVYDDLHDLARKYMKGERADHTLQTTALLHAGYLRLREQKILDFKSKDHLFAIMARQFRRVLVDHARSRQARKRGGGAKAISLEDASPVARTADLDLVLAVNEALTSLATLNPRQARAFVLKYLLELSIKEVAEEIAVSESTVKDDLRIARAFVARAVG